MPIQFRDENPGKNAKSSDENSSLNDLRRLINDDTTTPEEKLNKLLGGSGAPPVSKDEAQAVFEVVNIAQKAMDELVEHFSKMMYDSDVSEAERMKLMIEFSGKIKKVVYTVEPIGLGTIIAAGVAAIAELMRSSGDNDD